MFELTDGRDYAYQWDTGLYVDCTGLAESDEVHFCRPGQVLAIHPAMQGETLAAPVPDELLQQAQPIIVYAYAQTVTGEITKVSARLCVTARPKPPGYIASPTEALRWEHLQEQIGDLADLHTQDKTSLVAAVNEAMTQGGAADPKAVQQIVEDYLAENPPTVTETDPTVPEWAKAAQKPSYTASEVGADPSGTAASQVSAHNTGTDTHSDIRLLISGLTDRLNALADSDDTTLDQLSEVVAYIKNNRSLVEAITTNKVSVADIVDNLTTNVANKPLSAAQGVALKALIDAISIPDKLPNPNALTFTGAVTGSYDGSAPLSVDIPSGGGSGENWRLVNAVTTAEDVKEITITQDSDGNAFSLKKVKAVGRVRGNSSSLTNWIRITANNHTSDFCCDWANGFAATDGQDYYYTNRTDFSVYGNALFVEMNLTSLNNAASKDRLQYSNKNLSWRPYLDGIESITSLKILSSSSAIGAGTEIYVYGVDA